MFIVSISIRYNVDYSYIKESLVTWFIKESLVTWFIKESLVT